jgi:hypothetical protein
MSPFFLIWKSKSNIKCPTKSPVLLEKKTDGIWTTLQQRRWYQQPTSSMVLFGNGSEIFTQKLGDSMIKSTNVSSKISLSFRTLPICSEPKRVRKPWNFKMFPHKIDQFAATAFNKSRFFQGLILQWSGMDHLDKKFLHSVLRLDCHPYVILTWRIHIAAIYLHLFIVFSMFDLQLLNFNIYAYMWCIAITKLSNPIYSNMLVRVEYALSMSPPSHSLATKRSFSHPEGQTKYMNHYCNKSWQLLLVGGWPTPLKNMSQLGLVFPIYMESHKAMFQTTTQIKMQLLFHL